ncbi:putative metal ion binding protein [Trypoxylus dichotomus]
MALVCDIKSESKVEPPAETATNEDLEDGEIEDDDEDVVATQVQVEIPHPPKPPTIVEKTSPPADNKHEKYDRLKYERSRTKHEEKKKGHLTEAEKSVMFLHKLERMEREKREKYRREPGFFLSVDDFASNIEKAIANVLKKEKPNDEEKDDDKRGRKRKKKERDRKKKQRKSDFSPKSDEVDEIEMLNIRGGSPEHRATKDNSPRTEETLSDDTEYSSEKSGDERDRRERRRDKRGGKMRTNRGRDRRMMDSNRENKNKMMEQQPKDSPQLCVYYLQGKCQKGDDCQYSHESQPPMKWELCKFYLNDCCAKGQPCLEGDNCKFAHGKPLSERLKQILFKHIETAPKDILGRFPRMNREEAAFRINLTQKQLEGKFGMEKKEPNEQNKGGIPSLFDISISMPTDMMHEDGKKEKSDKPVRSRPSRWQEPDPLEKVQFLQEHQRKNQNDGNFKPFPQPQDQDMRLNSLPLTSNGDIDMRTLPPMPIQASAQPTSPLPKSNVMLMMGAQKKDETRPIDIEQYKREAGFGGADPTKMDVDIRSIRGDTDIRNHNNIESMTGRDVDIRKPDVDGRQKQVNLFDRQDIDIRQQAFGSYQQQQSTTEDEGDDKLEIVISDDAEKDKDNRFGFEPKDIPINLPKRQRELYMRIQAQQKENLFEEQRDNRSDSEQSNIDWYSDDSNEGKLMIKCDEDVKETKEDEPVVIPTTPTNNPPIKPAEMVEKLGDLSKINISEEVTKLLSSMRQNNVVASVSPKESSKPRDPRQAATSEEPKPARLDPRKARLSSADEKVKSEKVSIYEQGSIETDGAGKDVDLRSIDKDLDLRPNFGDLSIRGSTSASGRPDVDLRQLSLPFKAMQNYTPATEIDASYNSHPPINWVVHIIDIPKPDYTGLKLSKQEAQTTGDPRLRKIFRLDLEEKDSPASPKQSPKSTPTVRVDPRIRKAEEPKQIPDATMSYAQQMNVLQGSSFYQNLTSNQKVMLNQELSNRDQSGGTPVNEQVLAGILSALGLLQGTAAAGQSQQQQQQGSSVGGINGNVLSLLSTISNISQLGINPNLLQSQNPNQGLLGQLGSNPNILPGQQVNPNLLSGGGGQGAAPGIPNIPPDFPINFDPRNGGLLGNAPPFVSFPQQPPQQQQGGQQGPPPPQGDNQNFNFSDDFFPDNSGGNFNNNRGDGRFNRDNRPPRRGRNFNRNNRNNFRSRNRSNRGHTPP